MRKQIICIHNGFLPELFCVSYGISLQHDVLAQTLLVYHRVAVYNTVLVTTAFFTWNEFSFTAEDLHCEHNMHWFHIDVMSITNLINNPFLSKNIKVLVVKLKQAMDVQGVQKDLGKFLTQSVE